MNFILTMMLMNLVMTLCHGQYRQGVTAPTTDYDEPNVDYDDKKLGHLAPRSYASGSPESQRQVESSPKPTPVAILKQINRHNEDGSYTYGFEGGDGSFKIETKLPNGEVKGKYGFVDDAGKVRVVEYGADQYGFQPAGEGITVAPPTLIDETTNKEGLQIQNFQDYDYGIQQSQQQQHQPASAANRPQRPLLRPSLASQQLRQQQHEQHGQQQQQQLDHTQVIYPREPALAPVPAPAPVSRQPIFSPAGPSNAPQSRLISQLNYDQLPPVSQAHNQGPVQFNPAPVREPVPHQVQRASPVHRVTNNPQSGGILDQLAKDYALPQGVAPPLHDISFGYY